MAIVFTQPIANDRINMAYNNNVIRFTSDEPLDILNADITLGGQSLTIYPNPTGDFYFNFKEYITTALNTFNFIDYVEPALNPADDTTFTYAFLGYTNIAFQITVNFTDDSSDTFSDNIPFLSAVQQIETYKKGVTQTADNIILLPLMLNTTNKYYAKYYEGYPFDVAFLQQEAVDLELTNNTNLLDYTFEQKGNITRLVFSDGRTDESINDLLPIALGVNEIAWLDNFLYIEKADVCSGVYLKWYNNYGGYSYWLFPNYAQRTQTMRSIGEINTDFENIEDTFSQTSQIGTTGGQRLVVNSDKLTEDEFNLLSTILTSPKVMMFTGEPFSQAEANDWMEVRIANTNQRTRNFKGQALEINIDLELPDLYTMTI